MKHSQNMFFPVHPVVQHQQCAYQGGGDLLIEWVPLFYLPVVAAHETEVVHVGCTNIGWQDWKRHTLFGGWTFIPHSYCGKDDCMPLESWLPIKSWNPIQALWLVCFFPSLHGRIYTYKHIVSSLKSVLTWQNQVDSNEINQMLKIGRNILNSPDEFLVYEKRQGFFDGGKLWNSLPRSYRWWLQFFPFLLASYFWGCFFNIWHSYVQYYVLLFSR